MTVHTDKDHNLVQDNSGAKKQSAESGLQNSGRRSAIRKLAVGAAALAGCSVLPEKWTAPLVEFAFLPAHAATSGAAAGGATKADTKADSPYTKTEVIPKAGYISIDKVLRPKFISKKIGKQYGKSIKIVFNTGGVIYVPDTAHDVITREDRVYRSGGKPSYPDIPTMEVYAEPKSKATSITIHYIG